MIKPLNNHCLIEVVDEYDGILRDSANEQVQKGVLRDYMLTRDHITASTGYAIVALGEYAEILNEYKDKTVYWQEYADSGSKFTIAGKKYVLVPFYRLIGVENK